MEDPALITAASTFIVGVGGAIGAVVAFFIRRADTRRKENRDQLIAHLQAELAAERKKTARLETLLDLRESDGMKWWGQIKALGAEPVPENWTPLPKDKDE